MSAESSRRENLHLAILQVLASNPTRFGAPETRLRVLVRAEHGITPSDAEWQAAMLYVEQARLIELVGKPLNPENRNWRIAKEGTDFLAERGYL